jgi:hypothetical protein
MILLRWASRRLRSSEDPEPNILSKMSFGFTSFGRGWEADRHDIVDE